MFDVFISYRRSDGQVVADELYRYLTAKGLRVFLDKEKLEKGGTFPEQLREKLLMAPNYILIASNDVFKFRDGKDWVREEIEIAVREYKSHPADRTITTLVFKDTVFPDTDELPQSVRGIEDVERVVVPVDLSEFNGESDEIKKAFKTIFGVATKITSANLWNAAHRWLENSKKEKSRFSNLNICESILPNVGKHIEKVDIPILVHSQNNTDETKPLYEAIMESEGHLYLIGQGGIGKTTALMHIMNQAYAKGKYQEGNQIPIFVELSFAPDNYGALYKTEVSSFIRRSVYRQIRTDLKVKQIASSAVDELDEIFSIEPEVAVNPVTDIFSKQTPAPEYLLLLDGLNEVSTVRLPECDKTIFQMVTEEIQYLMDECPNVRVVLTSRFDETDIGGKQVSRLQLMGVENDVIRQYLLDNNVSEKKIEKIYEDKDLIETLRIPLFLTMYVYLKEDNEAVTQGEILRLFFSERKKNIDLYTNQDRLEMLEKNVSYASTAIQLNRVTSEMYYFMLDFILPELAWQMEKDGLFYLSSRQIRKIIEPVLSEKDDLSICGEFGSEVFSKYRSKGKANLHVDKVSQKMRNILGEGDEDSFRTITENILTCCMLTLGVLQENNQRYGFVHQHIRDYFAAVKNINTMKLALYMYEEGEKELALECMNQVFYKEPVGLNVRKFIGEYLGEHKNKPYYDEDEQIHYGVPKGDEDRNQIDKVLNIYRGYHDNEVGYGLFSLIKILCEIRGALAGGDYSQLDLSKCSLYDSGLGTRGIYTNLNQTKINPDTLFFAGHKDKISIIHYTSDGGKIISYSDSGSVCVWDAKNGEIIKCVKTKSSLFKGSTVYFLADDERMIFVDFHNHQETISIWNMYTEKIEKTFYFREIFDNSMLSLDEKTLLLWNSSQIYTWSFETEELKAIHEYQEAVIDKCTFCLDGKEIYVSYSWFDECEDDEQQSEDTSSLSKWKRIRDMYRRGVHIIDTETKYIREDACDDKNRLLDAGVFQDKMFLFFKEDGFYIRCKKDITGEVVTILDVEKGKWREEQNYVIRFSNTGKWLAVMYERSLLLFDTNDFNLIKTINYQHSFKGIAFHDELDKFAVYTDRGEILVYDTNYFEIVLKMESVCASFLDMWYLSQGNQLVTYCDNGVLSLWDIDNKKLISQRKVVTGTVDKLICNKQKNQISLSSFSNSRVYQLPYFKEIFRCGKFGEFSKDGNYYYLDNVEDENIIYDTDTYSRVEEVDIKMEAIEKCKGNDNMYVEYMDCLGFSMYRPYQQIYTIHDRLTKKVLYEINTQYRSSKYEVHENRDEAVILSEREKMEIFEMLQSKDSCAVEKKWEIPYETGLEVMGLDLRKLHQDTVFSDEQKVLLRSYGAVI